MKKLLTLLALAVSLAGGYGQTATNNATVEWDHYRRMQEQTMIAPAWPPRRVITNESASHVFIGEITRVLWPPLSSETNNAVLECATNVARLTRALEEWYGLTPAQGREQAEWQVSPYYLNHWPPRSRTNYNIIPITLSNILDTVEQQGNTTNLVRLLGERGKICEVYGHRWAAGSFLIDAVERRDCVVCDKKEKLVREWR